MCYVAAIPYVAGALAAVTTYQQNQSAAKSYDAQADAYSNQAHQQIQQGADEAYQQTRQARSAGASQNAIMGANGVVSSTGTALTTLYDTDQQGTSAADQTRRNAYNQAETTQYQANIARSSADNTRSNNLTSSLLTGVSVFGATGGFAGLGWPSSLSGTSKVTSDMAATNSGLLQKSINKSVSKSLNKSWIRLGV
jgi:hypothetical protein